MSNIIFHIDVNNAFLSWSAVELLNKGSKVDIREECAVIAGDETKRCGVVLARSIEAKKKGVITGESLFNARRKCSNLKVYPPNHDLYEKMSGKLFELISEFTSDVEIVSIDECYVDYGKVKNLYGNEIMFAYKLKNIIKQKLGFTVNIGIANNKLCAKMASNFSKPDKVHTLYEDEIKDKMWILPIDELYGVGEKTSEKLKVININTIGDLANFKPNELYKYFKKQTTKMIDMANGIDNSIMKYDEVCQKGISHSTTLERDLIEKEELYKILQSIAEKITMALRGQNKYTYVVAVILRDKFFNNYTHQTKLKNATDMPDEIFQISKRLFNEMWNLEPIRLIGIRVDQLVSKDNYQLSIFEDFKEREKQSKLEKIITKLKEKYGNNVIIKASLVRRNGKK